MNKYTFFWSGPFSNWAFSPFVYKGVQFTSSEQAMMWEKAILFNDNVHAKKILKTNQPNEQKAYGRLIEGYDDAAWSAVRYDLVVDILRHKFTQSRKMREALMDTANTILVEASPVDRIWGIGLAENDARAHDEKTWLGLNLLGKALTQVRTEFENEEK